MDDIEKLVRRISLKPLNQRRKDIADKKAIIGSLKRMDDLALGQSLLSQLREVVSVAGQSKSQNSQDKIEFAKKLLALTKALYQARRISTQEYVFIASSQVEDIHSLKVTDGEYVILLSSVDKALQPKKAIAPN